MPADAWLERADAEARLLEESRIVHGYGSVLTLLWTREPAGGTIAEDELLEELSPLDFTNRRQRWPTRQR